MADSRVHAAASSARDSLRGATPSTASAIARMWCGVVPQQPPMKLSRPDSANSFSVADTSPGVSSYSAKALGRLALGLALPLPSAPLASLSKCRPPPFPPHPHFNPHHTPLPSA